MIKREVLVWKIQVVLMAPLLVFVDVALVGYYVMKHLFEKYGLYF
jgi:hypothetical protein